MRQNMRNVELNSLTVAYSYICSMLRKVIFADLFINERKRREGNQDLNSKGEQGLVARYIDSKRYAN